MGERKSKGSSKAINLSSGIPRICQINKTLSECSFGNGTSPFKPVFEQRHEVRGD